MPSTYSSNLKLELMATGENSGTWGNITNTNLGTAAEQAIVGYGAVNYLSDANLTISITNSNAAQAARALVLNVTSALSLTATRELVVPTIEKQYIVQNNTTGSQSITVKTSAGTGITVPNGRKAHLYVDGTNVIQMFDFVDINGGAIDGTAIGASSASTGAFTTLNASGATTLDGNVTLGNASGDNITFTGTINSHLLFTDNTYDIGASGATRPRNLFLAGNATVGGNLSVGGTLTLTGGVNLNGNVTVGDNASDTLTINATITSNLLFTDNTYDIGASGATRPRNLFLAGNITAGGNQTLTGSLTVDSTTDSTSATTGSIQTDGGVGIAKALFVGTSVTINGGTANGVAYLNGSKVLTTGSALTFDGARLGITAGAAGEALRLDSTGDTYLSLFRSGALNAYVQSGSSGVMYLWNTQNGATLFGVNNAEQMRLIANNLLLGTTTQKVTTVTGGATGLTIGGASAPTIALWDTDNAAYVGYWSQINNTMYFGNNANGSIEFGTNSSTKAILTAGGNLLLGTVTDAGRLTVNGNIRTLGGNVELDTGQITTNSSSNPLILGVNGTERGRFTGNGEFLVGTTTANAKVKLSLTSPGTLGTVVNVNSFGSGGVLSLGGATNNNDGVYFGTGDTGGTGVASGIGFLREGSGWNSAVAFYTNNVTSGPNGVSAIREVGRFSSAGSFLVGTNSNLGGNQAVFYGTGGTTIRVADDTNTSFRGYVLGATIADSAEYAYLKLNANSGELRLFVGPNTYGGYQTFFTSGTERARIDTGGDFMIGTTSSSGRLTVVTGTGAQAALFTSGSGTTQQAIATFSNSTNSGYLSIAGVGTTSSVGTWTNGSMVTEAVPNGSGNFFLGAYTGDLVFQNGRNDSGRFTSVGNFLVGTSNSSSTVGSGFKVLSPVAGHWDPAVVTSGNSASYSCWDIYSTSAGAYRFYVTTTGVINATSTTITAISDQRLKENVRDIDTGLDAVLALKPRRFDWKEGKGQDKKNAAGFIAQEFETVFPDSVGTSKAGEDGIEYKNICHEELIPTLVKAIQEQQAIITQLKARLDAANL